MTYFSFNGCETEILLYFFQRLQAEEVDKEICRKIRQKTIKTTMNAEDVDEQQFRTKRQSNIEVKQNLFVMYDINFTSFISATEHNRWVRKEVW